MALAGLAEGEPVSQHPWLSLDLVPRQSAPSSETAGWNLGLRASGCDFFLIQNQGLVSIEM